MAPRPLLWPLLDLRCEIMAQQSGFFAEIMALAEEVYRQTGKEGSMFTDLLEDRDLMLHSPLFRSIGSKSAIELFAAIDKARAQLPQVFARQTQSVFKADPAKSARVKTYFQVKEAKQQFRIVNDLF